MQVREKIGKSQFIEFISIIWVSGGWKNNLAKAAGAEPAGQIKDEKLPVIRVRNIYFQTKIYKISQVRTIFSN